MALFFITDYAHMKIRKEMSQNWFAAQKNVLSFKAVDVDRIVDKVWLFLLNETKKSFYTRVLPMSQSI